MVAYKLYLYDEVEGYKLIGILPERRKNPKRITKESVLKWGRILLGDSADGKRIIFKQIMVDDITHQISEENIILNAYLSGKGKEGKENDRGHQAGRNI